MRERFRGRPLGGFLHAVFSLDLGVTHRCAVSAQRPIVFTRNTPCEYPPRSSPHAANIDCPKVDQQCGGILTRYCCSCVSARIEFRGTCAGNDNEHQKLKENIQEKLKVNHG